MAKKPILMDSGPIASMWTTARERVPPNTLHYALNMLPLSVDSPVSPWMMRGQFTPLGTGTAAGNAVVAHGQLAKVDGTEVTWYLSSSSGLWVYNWGAGTYSNVVTAANFTTASISLVAATHYWCIFNNTICFNPSDGVQKPFTWDGTSGAGSLTELTNAPTAYGRPTAYAAKLFFIKYAFRDTIAWSEEATANTGYDQGGYSNEWKLGQTGTNPLYAIQGTNEALYYFRGQSIGSIRGQVSTDFVTTATHDAISLSTGTLSPNGVAVSSRGLWFVDQWFIPSFLPFGGSPARIVDETFMGIGVNYTAEPFGYDDLLRLEPEDPGPMTAQVLAVPVLQWLPYETVWFNFPSDVAPNRVFLVVSQDTGKTLSWVKPQIDSSVAMHKTIAIVKELSSGQATIACVDGVAGRGFISAPTRSPDKDEAGVAQSTTYRIIGAPLGPTQAGEYQFDRFSVTCSVRSGSHSLSLATLTSRRPSSALASAAQTKTLPTSSTGVPSRLTFGLNQNGRWLRPVFTLTTVTAQDFTIESWLLWAYPASTSPSPA